MKRAVLCHCCYAVEIVRDDRFFLLPTFELLLHSIEVFQLRLQGELLLLHGMVLLG